MLFLLYNLYNWKWICVYVVLVVVMVFWWCFDFFKGKVVVLLMGDSMMVVLFFCFLLLIVKILGMKIVDFFFCMIRFFWVSLCLIERILVVILFIYFVRSDMEWGLFLLIMLFGEGGILLLVILVICRI